MSVQLDELFDEPPGVVAVVLSHAIEEAGWRLLHVSEVGDELVWEVDQGTGRPSRLHASIVPDGGGARVTVVSVDPGPPPAAGVPPGGRTAQVIDLFPRVDGDGGGFGPSSGPNPPFGPA